MANTNLEHRVIVDILKTAKAIAVVGHSDKPARTSYQIAQFLRSVGYQVYPVNPILGEIEGQPCYPNLKEIPAKIDVINVFRRSEFLSEIVSEAIAVQVKTVWGQLGVIDETLNKVAKNAGLNLIMDRCIKIEYNRLNLQNQPSQTD
ncbi:MAG: CoA-binding protein [Cyanobacteriota bacterium]|nr:CoA-binding protein [Cyanobacteriota bacterium]